jgi:hypothetical protein
LVGDRLTFTLRSLQLPQPRRDLRCVLRWRGAEAGFLGASAATIVKLKR